MPRVGRVIELALTAAPIHQVYTVKLMRFDRLLRISAVLSVAAAAACGALAADTVVQEIVARVNSQIITRSDLQRSREQMRTEARTQGISLSDPRVAENDKHLLRDLIDQQLLMQKGQELGITGDTDLVKRLDDMRKGMGLSSLEQLEEEAKKQGVSFEEFKQNLRNNIVTQQVIQREVGGKMQISPQEVQKFYEDHKQELAQPEQVRLSEILIALRPGPEAESLAAAEKLAADALAQIKGGKSFEEVAKAVSGGPTAEQGGDLGYFKHGALAKELEDLTFAMKTGNVSNVIRTKQGFVLLKVTEHQEAGVPPLKQVELQVQETIYMQRLQPALRLYLTKLREDSFVDVKTGYVDSGASPNQTLPVAVSANEPAKGKAPPKHRRRMGIFPR